MKQGIIISACLHLFIICAVLFSAPFSIKKKAFDYEVIKINAVPAPQSYESTPAPIEDILIPEAIADDDLIDIPMEDPIADDNPVVIDKPKPEKPKPKPDKPKPKKPTKKTPTKAQKQPSNNDSESNGKEIDTKSTSEGSPFAGATVDNASFDYPYWFTQAFNKINRNFKQTVSIDGNVICVVYFEVIKSGRVLKIEVVQSSGIPGIDRDCIAAIERSKPFPPLPDNFRDEIIGITIPIKY